MNTEHFEINSEDEGYENPAPAVVTNTNKRRTSKEVGQDLPKPKIRSKARGHQSFNERYLTNKKES